jgi:phage-related protein
MVKAAVCEIRPMPSVGSGVFELKEQDERAWYRVMYLAKVMDVIYVLHCFEKNTNKTSQRDLDTAQARLKEVNAEIREKRARLRKGKPRGSH